MKQLTSERVRLDYDDAIDLPLWGDVVSVTRLNDRFVEIISLTDLKAEGVGVEPASASPKAPPAPRKRKLAR